MVTLICNRRLVCNIWMAPDGRYITVHSYGGVTKVRTIADFGTMGTVWFNQNAIANILGLADVRKAYRVTYDSAVAPMFTVHKPGRLVHFHESKKGFYYHDVSGKRDITLVNMVEENMEGFTLAKSRKQNWLVVRWKSSHTHPRMT